MRYSFAALALALLGQAVHASPLTRKTTTTIAGSFPVVDLQANHVTPHSNSTSSRGGLSSDAALQEFPADLLLCSALNCAGCEVFNLAAIPFDTCEIEFFYESVAISQPSGEGLPFAVFLTPPNLCATGTQIPEVNTCFNVEGDDFDDFILIA
ncbi:hypothetical protein BD414DRAFT_197579 [Trametes punicea]|nr:hypothetical protein BD414DRAFT_197579 [Trametes punicea]